MLGGSIASLAPLTGHPCPNKCTTVGPENVEEFARHALHAVWRRPERSSSTRCPPALLSPVLGVVTRTLSTDVTHRAGYRRRDAGSGVVPFIQRVGSALTLNVHLQLLVPDGAGRFVTALRLDRWPVNARCRYGDRPWPSRCHRLLAH